MKRCRCCGETKDNADFNCDKRSKDGMACYCRLCAKEKSKLAVRNNAPSRRRNWADGMFNTLHLDGGDY